MRRATRGVWSQSQVQLGLGGIVAGLSLGAWVAAAATEPRAQEPSNASRFQRLVTARRAGLSGGPVEPGTGADLVLSAQVSSQLVDEQLIENAARKAGVVVTEQEVDDALDACSRHLGGPAGLRALVEARFSDISELRTQLRIALLFERAGGLRSAVELPESAVQEFFDRTVGAFPVSELTLEETTVRILASDDAAAVARKQSQAAGVREGLVAGKAAQEARPRVRRVSEMELAPEVRDALRDAREGTLLPVLRTTEGFTVVRLAKRHPPVRPSYAAVRGKLVEELQRISLRERARGFMEELRKGAEVHAEAAARDAASLQAVPEAGPSDLGSLATVGAALPSGVVAKPPTFMPAPANLRGADVLPRACGNWTLIGEVVP